MSRATRNKPTSAILPLIAFAVGLLGPSAAAAATWPDRTGAVTYGDFDNDGNVELVVSSPETSCGEGVVYVVDIAGGTVDSWTQDTSGVLGTAECSDFFGADVVAADFDGDGYDDLAIGAPGANDSGTDDAGVVHVLYGSSSGLTAKGDQMFHQDSTGVSDSAEADDDFGASLEASDFDCDEYADLAIGVPLESWTIQDAGGVHVLYGSSSGISTVEDWWRQGLSGVPGGNEDSDHFGASLAVGNFNGDSDAGNDCNDLAIGIPDEDISGTTDAGRVYAIYGATSGLSASSDIVLHQGKTGVDDDPEEDDRFSARLSVVDDDADGYDDLVVIVPGDADGCTPSISVGRHVFHGGASGFVYANNALGCTSYGCTETSSDVYACWSTQPQFGSSAAEEFSLSDGDNAVWGEGGADELAGSYGNDSLFGGDGNDTLDGGPGLDVQVGGDGNDTFTIDADCEVTEGEVIDGGPGTDVIESHLSESQLEALGLTIVSIETFTTVSEHPYGDAHCFRPLDADGRGVDPIVTIAWDDLPDEDSQFTTSDGELDMTFTNTSGKTLDVDIVFALHVRGETVEIATDFSMSSTYALTLDLDDFTPAGSDPSAGDPTLYSSAWISARAAIEDNGTQLQVASPAVIFGHIDVSSSEAVLYRSEKMYDTWDGGDLGFSGTPNPSEAGILGPPVEGMGTVCVPS